MPVEPLIAPLLAVTSYLATAPDEPVAEQRRVANERGKVLMDAYFDRGPEPAEISHRTVPVDGGEIRVRVYRPEGEGPFPAHLYIHGGGFWLGTLDSCDHSCREICVGARAVVVSVEYRLAPEHPFPTPPEDCYAALCWLHDNAGALGVDARALSVGGESAGGGLSAAVALMTRDRGGPRLALQVLGIPVTDLTMSQPSLDELGDGYLLRRPGIAGYVGHYLADPADATHPYASPLLAPDLSGLAPALVTTMAYDPLRDEGDAYARRLAEAGVPVRHLRWAGQVHGSALFTNLLPAARAYHGVIVDALAAAYLQATEKGHTR